MSSWLADDFTNITVPTRKRLGTGLVLSLVFHGVLLAAILALLAVPTDQLSALPVASMRFIFAPAPGPSGGGGGSPTAAANQQIEVPAHTPPPEVIAPSVPTPEPPPQLNAPVVTTAAEVMRASGGSTVTLADYGGRGRGAGLGPGRGDGVGDGERGGFGGGAVQLGVGITPPRLLKPVKPAYTADAMKARIQGTVTLEAVLLANGTVGDVRVTRSLEPGLDQQAIKAAKQWLFAPATDREGNPVAVLIPMALDFNIF